MTRKNRVEYLLCTLSVAITGFLIYGFVGSIEPLVNGSKELSFLVFGCLGGFGFSMVLSTIILSVRFFAKRGVVFKTLAAILWPITFAACVYAGTLLFIPYQIFNISRIVTGEKKK